MVHCSLVRSVRSPHTLVMTLNAASLARIYRSVLEEAFSIAKASVELDRAAATAIQDAFSAAIPSIVPMPLAHKIGAPTLTESLKAEARQLLLRICASSAMPRTAFVSAVATAVATLRP